MDNKIKSFFSLARTAHWHYHHIRVHSFPSSEKKWTKLSISHRHLVVFRPKKLRLRFVYSSIICQFVIVFIVFIKSKTCDKLDYDMKTEKQNEESKFSICSVTSFLSERIKRKQNDLLIETENFFCTHWNLKHQSGLIYWRFFSLYFRCASKAFNKTIKRCQCLDYCPA